MKKLNIYLGVSIATLLLQTVAYAEELILADEPGDPGSGIGIVKKPIIIKPVAPVAPVPAPAPTSPIIISGPISTGPAPAPAPTSPIIISGPISTGPAPAPTPTSPIIISGPISAQPPSSSSSGSGSNSSGGSNLASSWSAQVKSTLPSLEFVMSGKSSGATVAHPPGGVPAGAFVVSSLPRCGDGDVAAMSQGQNPMAQPGGQNVQFYSGSAPIQTVLGYWVVPQASVGKGGSVPSNSGSAPVWFPLAAAPLAVASSATSNPSISQMNAVNKVSGQTNINTLFTQKVSSLVNQAKNSYQMQAATANAGGPAPASVGSSAPYSAYFAVMACMSLNNSGGTNVSQDLPDSLEISDFLVGNGANSIQNTLNGASLSALSQPVFTLAYGSANSPGPNPSASPSGASTPLPAGLSITLGASSVTASNVTYQKAVDASKNALYQLGVQVAGLASGATLPSQLAHIDSDLKSQQNCSAVNTVSGGESSRWFEPFPMQVACGVLSPSNFDTYYNQLVTSGPGPNSPAQQALALLLMQAGIVQAAENQLASDQSTLQATARCFDPSQDYINTVLSSQVIPFSVQSGALVAVSPGQIQHPESSFADGYYESYYHGNNFDTVFGMNTPVSASATGNAPGNAAAGIPLVPGSSASNPTTNNLIQAGIGLTIDVREVGTGNTACPWFCEADLPGDSYL